MVRTRSEEEAIQGKMLPGAVIDPAPPQPQEAATEHDRCNKNNGHIYVLCFAQTAYRQGKITDRFAPMILVVK